MKSKKSNLRAGGSSQSQTLPILPTGGGLAPPTSASTQSDPSLIMDTSSMNDLLCDNQDHLASSLGRDLVSYIPQVNRFDEIYSMLNSAFKNISDPAVKDEVQVIQDSIHHIYGAAEDTPEKDLSSAVPGFAISGIWPVAFTFLHTPTRGNLLTLAQQCKNAVRFLGPIPPPLAPPIAPPPNLTGAGASTSSSKNKRPTAANEFQTPKKTAKRKDMVALSPAPTKNKFQSLVEDEPDSEMDDTVEPTSDMPQVEPIFLKMMPDWQKVIDHLTTLTKDPFRKKVSGEFLKLLPATIDDYRTIQKALTEGNIPFFALQPKAERPIKVVLRGLPKGFTHDEIRQALVNEGFDIQRVSQMRRFDKNTQTRIPLPMFVAGVYPTDDVNRIYDLKTFMGFLIKVERYKNKGVRQCYNCQLFHHSSDMCRLEARCLKCGQHHLTKDCKKPRSEPAVCANCGLGHPANYTGCKHHPKQIRLSKTKSPKTTNIMDLAKNQQPAPSSNKKKPSSYSAAVTASQAAYSTAAPKKSSHISPQNNTQTPQVHLEGLDEAILKLEKIDALLMKISATCDRLGLDAKQVLGMATWETNLVSASKTLTDMLTPLSSVG